MSKITLREGWHYSKADLRLSGVVTYLFPALKTLNCIGAQLKIIISIIKHVPANSLSIILAQWKPTLDFLSKPR